MPHYHVFDNGVLFGQYSIESWPGFEVFPEGSYVTYITNSGTYRCWYMHKHGAFTTHIDERDVPKEYRTMLLLLT